MARSLVHVKEAKQMIKDVVFGYIRQQTEIVMNGRTIPQLIHYLCLQFYYVKADVWDTRCLSDAITLKENTVVLGNGKKGTGTSNVLNNIFKYGVFELSFLCNCF
eukprot:1085173_1